MASLRRRKKNGKWVGNWKAVFPMVVGGKRINEEISLETTNKNKAREELSRIETERGKGSYSLRITKRLFESVAKDWLDSKRPELKRKTIVFYEERLNNGLKPAFDRRTMDSITTTAIERYRNERAKNVSARTVNAELTLLFAILDYSIRMGYVRDNACRLVKKLKQKRKQFPALSKDEVGRLIEATRPGRSRTFMLFLLGSGLRLGEALGAKWKNLDWKEGTYTVNEAFDGYSFNSPKTRSSVRTVSLPATVVTALRDYRKQQMQEALPEEAKGCDLIFRSRDGKVLNHRNVRRWIYSALKRAELDKKVRLHDLRAAFCTFSLESGANIKVVQAALGHSTSKMTMEIYARVNESSRQEAATKLEDHLFAKKVLQVVQ